MPALPQIRVEVAWTANFADPITSYAWSDVSAYLDLAAGWTIGFGRSDEFETAQPNTLTGVRLFNQDGRFTPDSPGTTAAGTRPRKGNPIRVSVRYPGDSWRVRFTGYVDEWAISWPAGGQEECVATVTASSRKARLASGRTLESHIRIQMLSTNPTAYWPMTETELLDLVSRPSFRDLTKRNSDNIDTNYVFASTNKGSLPVLNDGTPGPVDEISMPRFDAYSNEALIGDLYRYIGYSGLDLKIGTSGGFTLECAARVVPSTDQYFVTLMTLQTGNRRGNQVSVGVQQHPTNGFRVFMQIQWYNDDTGAPRAGYQSDWFTPPGVVPLLDEIQADALSGEIHHYAVTVSPDRTVASLYFDGTLIIAPLFDPGFEINSPIRDAAMGQNTWNAFAWVGHAAVHNRALTEAELVERAGVVTAADEALDVKMRRVLGRAGIPATEVVLSSRAGFIDRLLPTSEAGRTVLDVVDSVMVGLGGTIHDDVNGRPRVHLTEDRYNTTPVVQLTTAGLEIDPALDPVEDDRYLINSVEVVQENTTDESTPLVFEDAGSISSYGFYRVSQPVSRSYRTDMEDSARRLLRRFAQPKPRYRQVPVDVGDLPVAKRTAVLSSTVGTLVELAGLPSQAPAATQRLYVEGYSESYTLEGGHLLVFNTTPGADPSVLILNDPTYSRLDSGNVVAI